MSIEVSVPAGKYVVAVSGGVDSIVLLDILSKLQGLEMVIAHLDHGIRSNSKVDRRFVAKTANAYQLAFVFKEVALGAQASEDEARIARYNFLEEVRIKENAVAIITAHHQDDILETAIINLLRGTGRHGLTSLQSHDHILRPLLNMTKSDIYKYARTRNLLWNEDETNSDDIYLRNYVRHHLLPRLQGKRQAFLTILDQTKQLNSTLDQLLAEQLAMHEHNGQLDRGWFVMLPHNISREIMAQWLQKRGLYSFDRKMLERLVTAAKTLPKEAKVDIYRSYVLSITKSGLALDIRDR